MIQPPLLSVIIPTHNRSQMLARHLLALSQQTQPAEDFEVLVVADTCEDDTAEVVAALCPQLPFRVQFLSHSACSASATRNLGTQHAQGQIYFFLDDDVLAEPGLITAHLQAGEENRVVLGYSKPVFPEKPTFWQYSARLWWEDAFRAMRMPGYRFSYRDFFSGNVSMPAALFHRVGGFDTNIRVRLEDYELGLRLLKVGAKFCFAPQAVGYHFDNTDLLIWLQRIYKEGIADIQIGQRHPELRNTLFADFEDVRGDWGQLKRLIRRMAFSWAQRRDRLTSTGVRLAKVCEHLRLRGPWLHLIGALREYNYWRGVAWRIGGRTELASWIQEAPLAPYVMKDAPLIHLDQPESIEERQAVFDLAQKSGLRVALQGMVLFSIPPSPGFEPLRYEHLQAILLQEAKRKFIPALGIRLIRRKELDLSGWQL
jgi:GT2 family glycosyltransferase